MASEIPDIPMAMRKVCRRLNRWRSSHARRMPIPERLWGAAEELAREHGVFPTAKAPHLEYGKLKERAGAAGQEKRVVKKVRPAIPRHAESTATPTFMELITPRPGSTAKVLPPEPGVAYPICVDGKPQGPPEDCGGIPGYYNLLEALRDPAHLEHADLLDWLGGEFDPEAFSVDEVNRRLAPLQRGWAKSLK